MGLYSGIDLHSNHHTLTVIDDDADRRAVERRLPHELAITKVVTGVERSRPPGAT